MLGHSSWVLKRWYIAIQLALKLGVIDGVEPMESFILFLAVIELEVILFDAFNLMLELIPVVHMAFGTFFARLF